MRGLFGAVWAAAASEESVLRSVGPFAAAMVVAFWMLRRSDRREAAVARTAHDDLMAERKAHDATRVDRDEWRRLAETRGARLAALGQEP